MADDNVIQCPTCGKKFKLPSRPPATFACTQCATVMDLSGFRTEDPEPAAPVSRGGRAAGGAPAGGRAAGGRAAAGRAGRTTGGAAAARARRSRGQDDEDEGGGRGGPPPKKSNAIIWASLGGLVVVLFLALMLLNKKKVETAKTTPVATTGPNADAPPIPAMGGGEGATPSSGPNGTGTGSGDPATGDAAGVDGSKPPAGPYVSPMKLVFAPVDHHPDATADDKVKIDELIQKAIFESAGSDSRAAGKELVEKFGVKAAPRLINVFATIRMGEGFSSVQGRIKASITDVLLRRIDGYIERKKSPKNTPLKGQDPETKVNVIARYWTAWWLNGDWKTPNKPWDDRVDGNREDAPEVPGGTAPPPAMGGGETPDGGG